MQFVGSHVGKQTGRCPEVCGLEAVQCMKQIEHAGIRSSLKQAECAFGDETQTDRCVASVGVIHQNLSGTQFERQCNRIRFPRVQAGQADGVTW